MIKLDDDLLRELGLVSLPEEEKKKLLAHIYETLEMRVGMKLAEQMSDAQLAEFEQFIDRNDEAGALRWLETNFPNYKDVVAAEFENLKAEIGQVAPQILAASQQQSLPPASQQTPPQQYYQPQAQMPPFPGQQQAPEQMPGQPPAAGGHYYGPPHPQQHPQPPAQQGDQRGNYDLAA